MLPTIAGMINDILLKKKIISSGDKVVTHYGMEMLIVYTINIVSAAILGFIMGLPLETMLLYVAFIKLRGYNGGGHMKNHLLCYIVSMAILFFALKGILWMMDLSIHTYLSAMVWFPFSGLMFLLSPVEDLNKPLDDFERTVYRQRGLTVVLIVLAAVCTCLMLGLTSCAYAMGMAIVITSTSMVFGCLKNKFLILIKAY